MTDLGIWSSPRLNAGLRQTGALLEGPIRPDLLRDEVLAEIFAATATARADHPALVFDDTRLSYREVAVRVDALARGLLLRGLGTGDVIGLWLPRGPDLLIAQIAVTKAGAAWLPFDADAPLDRVAGALQDAGAKALISDGRLATRGMPCEVLTPGDLAVPEGEPLPARAKGLTPDSPAYIIYTSGSTGTPKGIVVTHRNICHFIRAANELYAITASDVIFQGASVAFDLSMEEIWIPYLVGATLVVASPAILGELEQLPDRLTAAGVTVLDTVPTLLGLIPGDLPSVRLILLGGEALPAPLVDRWVTGSRRVFNTYGPTEATVVATAAEMHGGRRVTIGRPIANYTCYVANGLDLVPANTPGELLIGGPGIARGYLNRPELTAEKFIENPFRQGGSDPVLYRSGDSVSVDSDGNLLFHGRIDDQVKIRGFRVELGEIETRLAALPGISQAAVVLRQDGGVDRLAAFVVADDGTPLDAVGLRRQLRETLPPYMVPGHFETAVSLPRLSSGKIDRRALQNLELTIAEPKGEEELAHNAVEGILLAAARQVFDDHDLGFEADFFTELGGHSLLAARFIAIVRQTPETASITLADLYAKRTMRALAEQLIERTGGQTSELARNLSFTPPPLRRRFLCGLAQAVALPFILALVTLQWLGVFITSIFVVNEESSIWAEMAILLTVFSLINLGTKAVIVALKWAVIGRTKPGRYPLWGMYYFRLWFVQRLVQVTTVKFLQGSPLMSLYLRALGAKVGRDAVVSEFEAGAIDLLSIGDCASTGLKTRFANVEVVGNEVVVGPIEIGRASTIGNGCTFAPNSRVEDGAELADLTAIQEGVTVPAFERWDGSPARRVGVAPSDAELTPPEASRGRRAAQLCVYALGYVVIVMLGLLPIFPAFYVLYNLDILWTGETDLEVAWSNLPLFAWPTAASLMFASMAIVVALRWIILSKVEPGTYSIHSWFYVRKWLLGLVIEVTLETLNSLYATIYMRNWYRLMGCKIGKGSEISTNLAGRYDLVEIGRNNFVGDEATLGDEEISRGWMTLKRVRTGDRVFLGNDSIVAAGADLGDDTLIGVKSKLPDTLKTEPDTTWFGSPAIQFPTRQRVEAAAGRTYQPRMSYLIRRAIFETIHTALPTAIFIVCGFITADLIAVPIDEGNWLRAGGILLASGVVIGMLLIVFAAAVKWAVMGVYKPTVQPMWSWWCMRTEAVAVLYGGLVGKASLEFLRGTPFLPWALRLFGTKIGKGVWMDCTDLTEFDCVTIGDFSVLNDHAVLQTHLYEDRVMKVGRVWVGRGVSVGAGSTVLYDTEIGDFARLLPLTVVMKGDRLPGHSEWQGAPSIPSSRADGLHTAAAPAEPTSPRLLAKTA